MLFARFRSTWTAVIPGAFVVTALTVVAGCGRQLSASSSSQLQDQSQLRGDVLSGRTGYGAAVLETDVPLTNSYARESGDWLILYWESAQAGSGSLATQGLGPNNQVQVQVRPGASVLALGPQRQLLKAGHVSAHYDYPCGPQGARCQVDVPTVEGDITYPCGPQGAVCRVEIPRIAHDLTGTAR